MQITTGLRLTTRSLLVSLVYSNKNEKKKKKKKKKKKMLLILVQAT